MEDIDVGGSEASRARQHASLKSQVDSRVNAEVAGRAAYGSPGGSPQIRDAAGEIRSNAVRNVVASERDVERARGAARVSQVIDYVFFLVYSLLLIRLALVFIGARSSSGFMQFILAVTGPLYAPFRGIVQSQTIEGGYTVAVPIVVALVAYMLLHGAINGLLRMVGHRKTAV